MNLIVNTDYTGIEQDRIKELRKDAGKALDRLWSGSEAMTGWVKLPMEFKSEDLEYILNLADAIKNQADLLVVIGVGGSYLGAKAGVEALPKFERGIPVRFLGNSFCSDYAWETLEEIRNRKAMVCVISKSGNTMEVKTAFEIVKPVLKEKYGSDEAVASRIIAITDKSSGTLREEAEAKGYTTLEIPGDVGGRYSVLSVAGLLPMAVSGIDIRSMIEGAAACAGSPEWDNDLCDYAIARYLLQKQGKEVEFLEMCQSRMEYFGEWLKQLYGESEGKEGGGLLPTSITLSTDLHSIGQYLQQGRQIFMETMFIVDEPAVSVEIPGGPQKGKTLADMNRVMIDGVTNAHFGAGIPIVQIHLPKLDAYNYGVLLYFLEATCSVTAMLSGVNPFDQPGVEAYKAEMRKLLG